MTYTDEQRFSATKRTSKLNLDLNIDGARLTTYWCRLHFRGREQFNGAEHRHSHFELHICLAGTCTIELDGNVIVLHEGRFICLPENYKHRILRESDDFIKFVWGFSITGDNKFFSDECLTPAVVYNCPPAINTMIDAFLFCADGETKKVLLYAVLSSIKNTIKPVENDEGAADAGKARFDAIRRFVSDHIGYNLTVDTVCRQFFVGERQLNRICRENGGVGIGTLIRAERLERIKYLLKNTDMKLKEIAEKVGFGDEFAMSKSFKASEGISPSEFRADTKK